jgi:hypothetical protein
LISRRRREHEKMEINLHGAIALPTRHLLKERLISVEHEIGRSGKKTEQNAV